MAKKDPNFDLVYIFQLFFKYRFYIIGLSLLAGILAVIGTMPFIYPPEFYASSIIYPANVQRYEGVSLLAEEPNVYLYGDSKDVEKLDNLSKIPQLHLQIIDSLNLWAPYGVDKQNDASPQYAVLRTFNGQVSSTRVQGGGLRISAYDFEPQRAADLVNYMVELIDQYNQKSLIDNRNIQIASWERSLSDMKRLHALYEDSTRFYRRKFNILNLERQTEKLLEEYLDVQTRLEVQQAKLSLLKEKGLTRDTAYTNTQARVRGLGRSLAKMKSGKSGGAINIENLQEGYDQFLKYEGISIRLIKSMENFEQKISSFRSLNEFPSSTIIKGPPAMPADKKAKPVRWLVLAATVLATFMASLLGVLLIDYFVKLKSDEG